VGLVGQPNAGKSSLLAALSAARPKVGAYPFTTLDPELGVLFTDTGRLVLADIPGLIEGASRGAGLGLRFLRHIERTRALAFVVDGAAADPWGDLAAVRSELAAYSTALAARPALTIVNKVDLEPTRGLREQDPRGAMFVSALTGEGLNELRPALEAIVRSAPVVEPAAPPAIRLPKARPRPEPPLVTRRSWGFELTGSAIERLLARTDFRSDEGLERFQARLRRLDVEAALEAAGARAGDTVRIGEHEFEFQP